MQVILDEIDGEIYADIILSRRDLDSIRYGEMVEVVKQFKRMKIYVGIKMEGIHPISPYEEEYWKDESVEGDEGI